MTRTNLKALNVAIRETLVDVFSDGPTTPDAVVTAFRNRYPSIVEELKDYGFNQFLKTKSRHSMKQIESEIEDNSATDKPLLFADEEIPAALPVKRVVDGVNIPIWISRKEAGLAEGRYYKKMLQANANACLSRIVDFSKYWTEVEPLLVANPTWKIGDAEAELQRRGVNVEDLFSFES